MLTIPDSLRDIYPNPVCMVGDTPVVVFRDHRWTLPIMALAAEQGILSLPATVIGFDRHPDSLMPACGVRPLADVRWMDGAVPDTLVPVVRDELSPRDDDWVRAGMELGIVGDMISFGSNPDDRESNDTINVTVHHDMGGVKHRLYRLGRPHCELSFKGALVDTEHPMVGDGLWTRVGWDHASHTFAPSSGPYVLDLDLDYWTVSWHTYTFPFPRAVCEGEFNAECQSKDVEPWSVKEFFNNLIHGAALVTIATEPGFCGGRDHVHTIMSYLDRYIFDRKVGADCIEVDYQPVYPDE